MKDNNADAFLKFEEFVAITTMSRLRSSMYRAKLADPWFYRTASRRPFRVGDRVEVVDSQSSDFGAIGKVVNVGKRKLEKGKEALNIVVDLGDDMISSFEPYSLNIVDHIIGPIGVLDEERRREITQKWAGYMSRRLEIHGPSEVKNDARRHAKVLCQRKTFEKSMYRSPESTTMGRDFRSTVSKDADLYAFGATVYAVMLRQDFDKGIHNSGMKRFRELAKGHGSLSSVMSKLLHRRRRSKRRSRRKKRSPSNLLSSPDLKRNSSHGSVLESMSSLFGFGSNDNDLENADEVASPRIIRHRLSSSVSGLSHSSNKLSSMLGSEIVDNGTVRSSVCSSSIHNKKSFEHQHTGTVSSFHR